MSACSTDRGTVRPNRPSAHDHSRSTPRAQLCPRAVNPPPPHRLRCRLASRPLVDSPPPAKVSRPDLSALSLMCRWCFPGRPEADRTRTCAPQGSTRITLRCGMCSVQGLCPRAVTYSSLWRDAQGVTRKRARHESAGLTGGAQSRNPQTQNSPGTLSSPGAALVS